MVQRPPWSSPEDASDPVFGFAMRFPPARVQRELPQPQTPAQPNADVAAARALEAFDADLQAFAERYPARSAMSVTVKDLAKATNHHRSRYSRLLKEAGLQEKPLDYIRRRLPEVRLQRGA